MSFSEKKKRKYWVHPTKTERETKGEFNLIKELFSYEDRFYEYFHCLCIRFVCMSVFALVNSHKYSLKIWKFIYAIHICHGMNRIEYGTYRTNDSSTETHKI